MLGEVFSVYDRVLLSVFGEGKEVKIFSLCKRGCRRRGIFINPSPSGYSL